MANETVEIYIEKLIPSQNNEETSQSSITKNNQLENKHSILLSQKYSWPTSGFQICNIEPILFSFARPN